MPSIPQAAASANSPTEWLHVCHHRVGKLMLGVVNRDQSAPPMIARAAGRCGRQATGRIAAAGVDETDRKSAPGFMYRQPKVAVVTDHDRGVDGTSEGVDQ